jgi:transposase-like protein
MCPRCKTKIFIKAGFVRGKQRFKCKQCLYHFVQRDQRAYPREVKIQAIHLYLEGVGFRGIGRLLKINPATVMLWIRKLGNEIQALTPKHPAKIEFLELDELWHYVGKKNQNAGYGWLAIVPGGKSSPLKWVAVQSKQPSDSGRNLRI